MSKTFDSLFWHFIKQGMYYGYDMCCIMHFVTITYELRQVVPEYTSQADLTGNIGKQMCPCCLVAEVFNVE